MQPGSETRYHVCSTAFGYAAIAFQTAPFRVKRVFLPQPHKAALMHHVQETFPAKPGYISRLLDMCEDIKAYFEGARIKTPWELLDLSGHTPLQRQVLKAVARVPYGEVRSYGNIAAQVGRPRAYRFVGTILARNPFPIYIPCHRVVRANGSLGGFQAGTDLKSRMLLLEKYGTPLSCSVFPLW
ncbi:MAG: methylated-DNA--[protein]-cysteine S-methyltransferase [Deltaproteobacteria bacterium]